MTIWEALAAAGFWVFTAGSFFLDIAGRESSADTFLTAAILSAIVWELEKIRNEQRKS